MYDQIQLPLLNLKIYTLNTINSTQINTSHCNVPQNMAQSYGLDQMVTNIHGSIVLYSMFRQNPI